MKKQLLTRNGPWQAVVLYVLNFFNLIALSLLLLVFLLQAIAGSVLFPQMLLMMGQDAMSLMMQGVVVGLLLFVGLWVLQFFVTCAFYRGQKWVTLFHMIVWALMIILQVIALIKGFSMETVFSLLIGGFLWYLGFACFRSPFFGKK
ncbi:MAG: hypothetical protein K9M51_02755 [Candidatus Gracilibacteria bacterium]|nr:hypothetical protein [Candidatus Gracilibacteria bacterium]